MNEDFSIELVELNGGLLVSKQCFDDLTEVVNKNLLKPICKELILEMKQDFATIFTAYKVDCLIECILSERQDLLFFFKQP